MLIDPRVKPRSKAKIETSIACACGATLTQVPAGLRLCAQADADQATEVRRVTCEACSRETVLRMREE